MKLFGKIAFIVLWGIYIIVQERQKQRKNKKG